MTEEEKRLRDSSFDQAVAMTQQGQRPTYAGTYDQQLQDIYTKIQNREPFKYDMNADPLYQMYKDTYVQGGQRAMRDTMGQAAALTGGYGNSYAQNVGQQRYDQYMEGLAAKIPELYSMAYQRYGDEGDRLAQQYQLLGQMRDTEYGKFRDELGDWERDRAWQMQEDETAYNRSQQARANLLAMVQATGYSPTDAELQAAGISRDQIEQMRHMFYMNNPAEWQIMMQKMGIAPAEQTTAAGGGGGSGENPAGGGKKYTLKDFEAAIAGTNHSNQVEDLYNAMKQSIQKGLTDFTLADLNRYMTEHHL